MALIPRPRSAPWQQGQEHEEQEQVEQGASYYGSSTGAGPIAPRWGGHTDGTGGYMDIILPPAGFSVWDLPTNKLKTTAVAVTFVATAGLITFLAAAGLLAILVTGAVVSASVLLLVTVCTGLVALIVTGVPVGYAIWQIVSGLQGARGGFGRMGGHGWHVQEE